MSSSVTKTCQSTKAPHHITQIPTPTSNAASSVTTSSPASATKRSKKADLPSELVADGRWQKVLIPTLLLWAGGNDDVWGVTRASVAYALPLIVDYHQDLDTSTMDFSWHGPIISVVRLGLLLPRPLNDRRQQAYQRLCDWRHNIASTSLAIIMSLLQCAESDREVRDMADMLLEGCSFMYKDLDSSSTQKAFRSHFMLQLLNAAHLQYVTGAMQSVMCIDPPLGNYVGVIGLCGIAVCSSRFVFSQLEIDRICLAGVCATFGIGRSHHAPDASSL